MVKEEDTGRDGHRTVYGYGPYKLRYNTVAHPAVPVENQEGVTGRYGIFLRYVTVHTAVL